MACERGKGGRGERTGEGVEREGREREGRGGGREGRWSAMKGHLVPFIFLVEKFSDTEMHTNFTHKKQHMDVHVVPHYCLCTYIYVCNSVYICVCGRV